MMEESCFGQKITSAPFNSQIKVFKDKFFVIDFEKYFKMLLM